MNERIKQLALQAGFVRNGDWGMKRWEGPRSDGVSDQDLEKFALLIVKECADLFDDDPESGTRYTGVGCRDMIKWYFGVKE